MPSFAKLSKCRPSSLPSLLPRWLSGGRRGGGSNSEDLRVPVDAEARKLQPKCRRLATCDSETSNGSTSTTCSTIRGSTSSCSTLSVPIDEATEVPFDLYQDLMEAGKAAKARHQHQKVRTHARGVKETTLVAAVISCEEIGPI